MEVLRIWGRNLETKKEIRKRIVKLRKERDPYEWQCATRQITDLVISHPCFLEASDICIYADIKGEAGTRMIMQEAWKLGKHVWLPKVEDGDMEFYLTEGPDELVSGAYGIPEPSGNLVFKVPDALMIMPGVAFDLSGHRIGYGGGFYDRYLEKHVELTTMALAFEDQIFDTLPAEEHDICPMFIVTQKRIIETDDKKQRP